MWKPYNNDKAPEVDGFAIGTHPNGSQIYVGRGAYDENEYEFGPGRISIVDPIGFYSVCIDGETKIKSEVEYMSVSKSCNCDWVTSNGENVPYAVTIYNKFEYHYWWIGRVFYTKDQFGDRILLGKIKPDEQEIWIGDPERIIYRNPPYDVLSCIPTNGKN